MGLYSRGTVNATRPLPHQARGNAVEPVTVWHPFLLALFPALTLVADNAQLLSLNRSVRLIGAATLAVTGVSHWLLGLVIRDKQKTGLLISLYLLLFSTYGHVYDFLARRINKVRIRHRFLLTLRSILGVIAVPFSLRHNGSLRLYTSYLNIVAGCLMSISLVQVAIRKLHFRQKWEPSSNEHVSDTHSKAVTALPDIYYIIVDAHASPSTLEEIYDFNIETFVENLRARGFFVAKRGRSNYAMTMLSLASSLNMDYLHSLSGWTGWGGTAVERTKRLIENSQAMRFLRSRGYRIIWIGSGFGVTQANRHADMNIECGHVDETVGRFMQATLIRPVADRKKLITRDRRAKVLRMFSELAKVPKIGGPKFIFAHIPSPQWPFLFDANGYWAEAGELDVKGKKDAYVGQLRFIDKKLEALVDEIISRSEAPPIIVIQSDHGPNFAFSDGYGLAHPPRGILREKMRNFTAIYLPSGESNTFSDSITPVNTLRLVFNHGLGTNFPLLGDRTYFSTLASPDQLLDVTDHL